ncbi:hypothetical protein DM860_004346 [Cuscuta australis]|uniref:Ferredoxin thioredoxin reductase alpha chain domain-containing protein n=1 Tax=Cuscuta australis TaxID=267555 RepID=A0A328E782_9ASTE|nr:hypothetical protein DM860_004346 [Cuscuta australis]
MAMATSSSPPAAAHFSSRNPSLLVPIPAPAFPNVRFTTRNLHFPSVKCSSDSTTIVDKSPGPVADPPDLDENLGGKGSKAAMANVGSKVRVTAPLKVYHVPKVPEFDLTGRTGVIKQYVAIHKGKEISANLPYKVEFVVEDMDGRKGPLKFFAHLREDEFEFLG